MAKLGGLACGQRGVQLYGGTLDFESCSAKVRGGGLYVFGGDFKQTEGQLLSCRGKHLI